MPLNTMKDLLYEQLNELHAAEKHSTGTLQKLMDAASSEELARHFRIHVEQAKERQSRLEAIFEELKMKPGPTSRAESRGMKGLLDDCLKLANMRKAEPHVRDAAIIAAAQHVAHDEIAGYGCARTWADLLGHHDLASMLQASLTEAREADEKLSRLAESLNKTALVAATA
ncbi:MAG: DUF892 family protein [Phycisphaeraceae bacterium]|nr:MAG: DUF892 family protein [Phycisphaeraceae bacterium]